MKKLFVLGGMLLMLSGNLGAQEKQPSHNGGRHTLSCEYGFSFDGADVGRLAPLPSLQEEVKSRYALHVQMTYQMKFGRGIGLELSASPRSVFSEEGRNAYGSVNYAGLAFVQTTQLPHKNLFLRGSVGLGYALADYNVKRNGADGFANVYAQGLGSSLRLTLGYKLGRDCSIGLQLGLKGFILGPWSGEVTDKMKDSYNGGFSKTTGLSSLMPSVGIVLTNPLGR